MTECQAQPRKVTGQPIIQNVFSVHPDHHPFKSMFAPVENVETPDAHTAILKLSKPRLKHVRVGPTVDVADTIYGDVPIWDNDAPHDASVLRANRACGGYIL